jgi:hypothetical protein
MKKNVKKRKMKIFHFKKFLEYKIKKTFMIRKRYWQFIKRNKKMAEYSFTLHSASKNYLFILINF